MTFKTEIKKERCPNYPFHLVHSTYFLDQYSFIAVADYRYDSAVISVYPFTSDIEKLYTTNI